MEIRLDGKTALITGGREGLGKGIALKFADAGADVAILARRKDVLDKARTEIEAVGSGRGAAFGRERVTNLMNPDQIAEAEQLVRKWPEEHPQ